MLGWAVVAAAEIAMPLEDIFLQRWNCQDLYALWVIGRKKNQGLLEFWLEQAGHRDRKRQGWGVEEEEKFEGS